MCRNRATLDYGMRGDEFYISSTKTITYRVFYALVQGGTDVSWSPGDPSPGHPALIARPGSKSSTPPQSGQVASVNAQVDLERANTPIASTFFTASLD